MSTSTSTGPAARYLAPDRFTRSVMNPIVVGLAKLGISIRGSRQLLVQGRTTGEWRTVPVNPLALDGVTYLVAPRGQTQWVRNLRAAGRGRLRRGRRYDEFVAAELDDTGKTAVLRAYLKAWGFEVGKFFDGVDADSSDERLGEIAAGFPVFRIEVTGRR